MSWKIFLSERNLVLNQFISVLYLLWKEELYILENNTISQRRKFQSRVQAILKQTFSIVSEFYFQWETLQIIVCENNRKKRWENEEKVLSESKSRLYCQTDLWADSKKINKWKKNFISLNVFMCVCSFSVCLFVFFPNVLLLFCSSIWLVFC